MLCIGSVSYSTVKRCSYAYYGCMLWRHVHHVLSVLRHKSHRLFRRRAEPLVYVALGDSTVEGVGASDASRAYTRLIYADLLRQYKNVTYHNFGKRGARVHDVVESQLQRAIATQPTLITLSIGANDALHQTSLKRFRADMRYLLTGLREQTQATIVMTNVPDFSFAPRIPGPLKPVIRLRIGQYNRVIASIANKLGVTLIDTFKESALVARRFPHAVSKDNFHPSDFGYTLWAHTMLTAIDEHMRATRHRHWWRKPETP